MSKFFKNESADEAVSLRQTLESKYGSARHNILLILAFTVINIILLVTNSNTYFLFSAYVPYLIVDFGMLMCGMYPSEYYGEDLAGMEFLGKEFLTVTIVIATIILILYLLGWIFSNKNRVGWLTFALVFFGIDTAVMLLITGFSMDAIVDIIFHGWVVVSLARGISAHYKLKKLPEEPELPAPPMETVVEEIPQQQG